MSRSSTVTHDEPARAIAVWRSHDGLEHVVIGAVGEDFAALKAWIIEHHGNEVVAIERRGSNPDPAPPQPTAPAASPPAASGAGTEASCNTDVVAEESSFDPEKLHARDVFGTVAVERAPAHIPRSVYLARRASTRTNGERP